MCSRGASAWQPVGFCLVVWLAAAAGRAADTDRKEPLPRELQGVGVTERLNGEIPRDLAFVDSEDNRVTLGQFFDGRRPVLLTLNYSNCPMLCSLQLNGLFKGLQAMPWPIGDKFQMVTVSIDPLETTERAAQTKRKYLKIYGRPGIAEGWHCLTGREENIHKLAKAVGYGYRYLPDRRQYAHPAVAMICTPDGRVSRYLHGIQYDPQTLRLSLLEASDGKIGTTTDQFILFCFHYDAEAGRYAPAAIKVMRAAGVLTIVVIGILVGGFWIRERKKARSTPVQAGP